MTTIDIDRLNEEDFRRSIENRLCEGRASEAIKRLRSLLAPYAGSGGMLPERFLTIEAADLVLSGWDELGEAVSRHDQPGRPVTALSIAFGQPIAFGQSIAVGSPGVEVPELDGEGHLRPHIETSYFSDNAYPFSQSKRDDLLEGYSFYGCAWSGDSDATDTALSLEGIDDLHGALAKLEARLLASDEPDEDGIRAGSLGACLLSALLVQAVTDQIARAGLPRPLCVMAGSSGVHPYFDAPVAGMAEVADIEVVVEVPVADVSHGAPPPRYSSLLMTRIPQAKKRAVLVLDESEDELASRISRLRSLNHLGSEDKAAGQEAIAPAPAPEMPGLLAATDSIRPLLAQKPAKKTCDSGNLLGLREHVPSADVTPPYNQAEPAALPACEEQPVGPGFTLLETDLQQRLRRLISDNAQPIAKAPLPAPDIPADEPAPHSRTGPVCAEDICTEDSRTASPWETLRANMTAPPARLSALARARIWLRGKLDACLARFGR